MLLVKHFWLRLIPEQPLHVDDMGRVNGRAVRGLIAAAALQSCTPGADHRDGPCAPGCLYWPLFGAASGLRIGPACATTSSNDVRPLPSTFWTCATHPGFKTDATHGMADDLIRDWIFRDQAAQGKPIHAPPNRLCPVCGGPLIRATGVYARTAPRVFTMISTKTIPIETTHRPVNKRGQAGDIFARNGQLLADGAYFVARLTVPDALEAPLKTSLNRALYLGGLRSRGMGAVRAELVARPDPSINLRARVAEFNKAVRAERRFYAAMDNDAPLEEDGTWYFTLDFAEGAVFDPGQLNDPLADAKALRNVRLLRQWRFPDAAHGWHTAGGLPARTLQVWRGCAVYQVPPEEDRVQLESALAYLEMTGIGLEREHGWGAVTICDALHLEQEPI